MKLFQTFAPLLRWKMVQPPQSGTWSKICRRVRTDCWRGDSKQCNMTTVTLPRSESQPLLHDTSKITSLLTLQIVHKRKSSFYGKKKKASPWKLLRSHFYLSSSHSPCHGVMLSSRSAFCLWLFPSLITIPNMVILLGVSHFPPQPIPLLLCVSSSAHSTVGERAETRWDET